MILEQIDVEERDVSDQQLVERAQHGDDEAFGELVRRHRASAYGYAISASRKHDLADEIVQEALIHAFLKLGNLLDPAKFEGWLHKIVRNQAYMKLRRGGPYRREQPVSSMLKETETDCFDSILRHLSYRLEANYEIDPEKKLMKKVTLEGIQELLYCLSSTERNMFIAFFFKELSPKEIAAMYETTTSNVYNHLSRSRRKLRNERIRVRIDEHIQLRRELEKPRRKVLDLEN
ncbi:RNA polymerase sigma factor [Pseudalkalibacillus sp. R45]|uniref:RNA polymerase sigma factor n=1 Tax=Pseudalkalibacillus sp. R45 TaxID=3457433 RepID=UPI003FCD2CB6